jgi:hypothetical protein
MSENEDEILHHGLSTGEFKPILTPTDYFVFGHEPCKEKKNAGSCDITAVLLDNSTRVIFNLKCQDCGKIDALKVAVFPF